MDTDSSEQSSFPKSLGPDQSVVCLTGAERPTVHDIDDGFSEFYRHEHDGQVRRAYLILGSSGAAHDVVADAFVAMLRRWDTIEEPGPYLNRCVLNGCRDVHRRAPRERLTAEPIDAAVATVSTAADATADIAGQLLTLPFRQRAAIVLRYYGGYREAEIAQYLDCRPGTVGSLIHRGLGSLRAALCDEQLESETQHKSETNELPERPTR